MAVEADFVWKSARTVTGAVLSPLRLGESRGKPFLSKADALTGGYSAGRRIVDDLFHS